MRAFVNREWERLKGLDMIEALRELDTPSSRQEIEPKAPLEPKLPVEMDHATAARNILGVTEKDGFDQVHQAFERISRSTQPGTFDEGSAESEHAQLLLRRATWAYNYLTKDLSSTEKRFRSLEIE